MGHQQAGRAAVLGRQGLAVVAEGHPRLPPQHIGERQIGGIVTIAERDDIARDVGVIIHLL